MELGQFNGKLGELGIWKCENMKIMTKIVGILLNWVMILVILSCSSSGNKKNTINKRSKTESKIVQIGKSALISGKIINKEIYPQTKEIELIIPDFEGNETDLFSEIDEKGEFRFEFFPKTKREMKLLPIANDFVCGPGDSLYLVMDFKDIGNVNFSGDGASLNTQICKYSKFFLQGYNSDYQMPNKEFKEFCNSEKEKYFDKLHELKQNQTLTVEFINWITTKIELDYCKALLDYPRIHFGRTKEILKDSTEYYSFVDKVPKLFNNSIIVSENFKISSKLLWPQILKIMKKYAKEIANKDTIVNRLIERDLILMTDNSYLSQFYLATFFANTLNSNVTFVFDRNRSDIDKKISDPFLKVTLMDYFDRVSLYNKNPKITSDALLGNTGNVEFNNRISLNQSVDKNLVKEIIDGNPNKVIYIDIWSSWCPGCRQNMRYSNKLIKDFAGKDVEFIFINVLDNIESWRKMIKELEIGGKHFYCDQAETMVLRKRFNYPGVPFYLMIDKKGVIVDYGYHIVPQNGYTKQAIERLLKE